MAIFFAFPSRTLCGVLLLALYLGHQPQVLGQSGSTRPPRKRDDQVRVIREMTATLQKACADSFATDNPRVETKGTDHLATFLRGLYGDAKVREQTIQDLGPELDRARDAREFGPEYQRWFEDLDFQVNELVRRGKIKMPAEVESALEDYEVARERYQDLLSAERTWHNLAVKTSVQLAKKVEFPGSWQENGGWPKGRFVRTSDVDLRYQVQIRALATVIWTEESIPVYDPALRGLRVAVAVHEDGTWSPLFATENGGDTNAHPLLASFRENYDHSLQGKTPRSPEEAVAKLRHAIEELKGAVEVPTLSYLIPVRR